MNWKQFDWLIKLMHLFYFYSFFLLLTVCFFVKCYNAGTSNSAPLVCYLITILLIGVSSGSSQVVSVSRGVSMTTCSLKWCLNHSFTLTSVVFKPHFSLCQMLSKARGSWWAQSNSVTVRYPAVPRVCMCVSSLCLYLETGKVCRSKSLRKAALIPSCVASTWNGCKWTNGNQPLFFPSLYADCLRQKARGAQQEVRDLIIRRRLCGCTYFLLELSSRPYQIFFSNWFNCLVDVP